MTILLDLTPDTEARLRSRASDEGQDVRAVGLRPLTEQRAEGETGEEGGTPTGRSMADLFAGRVGLVASSGEAYSLTSEEKEKMIRNIKRQLKNTDDGVWPPPIDAAHQTPLQVLLAKETKRERVIGFISLCFSTPTVSFLAIDALNVHGVIRHPRLASFLRILDTSPFILPVLSLALIGGFILGRISRERLSGKMSVILSGLALAFALWPVYQ